MITPPQGPPPRLNRLLGATSGPYEGNVRSLLAIVALVLVHAFVGALLAAVWSGAGELRDFLLSVGGAVVAADLSAMSFYFGRRSGEGG